MTAASHSAEPAERHTAWTSLAAALRAVRPRQWTKNALLFAALLFAGRAADTTAWREAGVAFVAYCLLSGAAYLLNDVRDRVDDRLHPVKCRRPVASGALPVRSALILAIALVAAGVGLAGSLGPRSMTLAAGFATLQCAYSYALKRIPFVDVVTIAVLFVVRASAGAAAVHVRVSMWLVACTALLALFLGFAKRRGELLLVESGKARGRPVLARYSVPLTVRLVWLSAGAAVLAYAIYAATARHSPEMLLTVPFVAGGVTRYLYLIRTRDLGEEPETVLLHDGPIIVFVALWAITAGMLLATT
jgi:4-hydroxybenzoate polyprenyltransferase